MHLARLHSLTYLREPAVSLSSCPNRAEVLQLRSVFRNPFFACRP